MGAGLYWPFGYSNLRWARGAAGSALESHSRGQGFESPRVHFSTAAPRRDSAQANGARAAGSADRAWLNPAAHLQALSTSPGTRVSSERRRLCPPATSSRATKKLCGSATRAAPARRMTRTASAAAEPVTNIESRYRVSNAAADIPASEQ